MGKLNEEKMSREAIETYLGKCKFSAHQIEQLESLACCQTMFHSLIDNVFQYDEIQNYITFTTTTVERIFLDSQNKASKEETYVMPFCTWCGSKLPNYSFEYIEALDKELEKLGITYEDIESGKAKIPEEFLSNAWWKNRGIHGLGHWWDKVHLAKWQRPFVDKD